MNDSDCFVIAHGGQLVLSKLDGLLCDRGISSSTFYFSTQLTFTLTSFTVV